MRFAGFRPSLWHLPGSVATFDGLANECLVVRVEEHDDYDGTVTRIPMCRN